MTTFTESVVEEAARERFAELGCSVVSGAAFLPEAG